jgi:transposase
VPARIPHTLGRLAPDFSDEQRAAVVRAVLEGGYTAREAAEAAGSGELGLDPFEVAASTIQGWLETHRRSEGVEESGSQEAEQARRMAQETIAAVENVPPAERTSKQLHALESALRVVRRTDRVSPRKPPPKPAQRDGNGHTRLEALIADSVAHVRAVAAGAPCNHWPGTEDDGTCIRCWQEIRRRPTSEGPLYVLAGPLESAEAILEREIAEETARGNPEFGEFVKSLPVAAPAAYGESS